MPVGRPPQRPWSLAGKGDLPVAVVETRRGQPLETERARALRGERARQVSKRVACATLPSAPGYIGSPRRHRLGSLRFRFAREGTTARPMSLFAATARASLRASVRSRAPARFTAPSPALWRSGPILQVRRRMALLCTMKRSLDTPAACASLPADPPICLLRPLLPDRSRPVARSSLPPARRVDAHLHLWPRVLAGQAPAVETRPHRPARPQAAPGPCPIACADRVRPILSDLSRPSS